MGIQLYDYQKDALQKMKNGCILCGGVGSGKSRTGLAYYFTLCGGKLDPYSPMVEPLDLYIITTARKRDTKEWNGDMLPFCITDDDETKCYEHKVVVDSWNNIKKYSEVENSFFIFDEQRVVGSGVWVKAFLKIAKRNKWILLSATPGDTWMDYVPVFIANGFYRNRSDFIDCHVVYNRYSKFPQVQKYLNQGRLQRLRHTILVEMDYHKPATSFDIDVDCDYNHVVYKSLFKERWNVEEGRPIQSASELCYLLRKVVNSDESRMESIEEILKEKQKIIVFYNYDYELDILKAEDYGKDVEVAEWNGHRHEPIPDGKSWVYLVQYTAGAEGWNCVETDTIVFYSQNYSYKTMIQASGRIDRLNTPFEKLYYYHLKSKASIDLAICKALREKRKFNESKFAD